MTRAAGARAAIAAHRRESFWIGAALLVAISSVAAGLAARGRLASTADERTRLRADEHDLAAFRSAFQQASLEERAFRFPDSLAVSTPRDLRFSVAERIARRAELLGLSDVRVRFTEADSAAPPSAPALSGSHIAAADYAIALDCRGDLGAVLSLVNALPASVALRRLGAERASLGGTVDYHVVLAVFESRADSARSPAGDEPVRQIARLLPYAKPARDEQLSIPAAPVLTLARDAFLARAMPRLVAAAPIDTTRAAAPSKLPTVAYHVTTTLMAGSSRAALINDQLIYVGERLPDGSTLTSVERDRVVVTGHNGTAHAVAVAGEGEG
jgi:hypothetical protein